MYIDRVKIVQATSAVDCQKKNAKDRGAVSWNWWWIAHTQVDRGSGSGNGEDIGQNQPYNGFDCFGIVCFIVTLEHNARTSAVMVSETKRKRLFSLQNRSSCYGDVAITALYLVLN